MVPGQTDQEKRPTDYQAGVVHEGPASLEVGRKGGLYQQVRSSSAEAVQRCDPWSGSIGLSPACGRPVLSKVVELLLTELRSLLFHRVSCLP